jgi:AmmeMemoRadiSam system protein B
MLVSERPRLRPHLAAAQDHRDPRYIFLWDRLGLAEQPQRFTLREFAWLQLFDGQRTAREVQQEAIRLAGGELVTLEVILTLQERLEAALFLEGPRFHELSRHSVRTPRHIGCYEGEPDALRRQLRGFFTHRSGPGLPEEKTADGNLRAALLPHIDYHRGGISYAWGFKEVVERTDASLFVIIGTSHYSGHRFTLTRKHFQTPLGLVETDQTYIDRLVSHYGPGLFDDELLAHLPEHSIELEVVYLQYLYEERRPVRIVPLVVGSFHDCVERGVEPSQSNEIRRLVGALRRAEAEADEPICYLISGDLAHIGPKFGDADFLKRPTLEQSRKQDEAIVRAAESVNPAAYFRIIAAECDARRICGLPPTYTVLEALRPARGKLLHYDQYVHPEGYESVSFASMAFYR